MSKKKRSKFSTIDIWKDFQDILIIKARYRIGRMIWCFLHKKKNRLE